MDYIKKDKDLIMNTYNRNDILLVSGSGAKATDDSGVKYIDFTSGIGVNSLGFCDADWAKAISIQANTLQHTSNLYYTKPCIELADRLNQLTGYDKVFFCNSGAEANECAIKLARKYSHDKYGIDRNIIVSLNNSFHGRTMATLTATGQDVFHQHFFPFLNCHQYIDATIDGLAKIDLAKTCAIMIELVQGEGGVNQLNTDFLRVIQDFCRTNDILLIADEVQTGICRTGEFLACQTLGVKANIVTLAKGLGGGLPIGACLCDSKCKNTFGFGNHATTYGGNPVVAAGANVVLDKIANKKSLSIVKRNGEYIKEQLLLIKGIKSVSGLGMMIGIELTDKTASQVVNDCHKKGLMILTAKTKVRLLPPLVISKEDIDTGLSILKSVLED